MKKLLGILSLFLALAGPAKAIDTVCVGATCPGSDQVVFTTNSVLTINSIIFPDATTINSANGLGGAGSAAALVLRMGNSFVTITTAIAGGDLVFQTNSGTGVFKVDLSSYAKVTDTTTVSGQYTYSSHVIFSSAAKFSNPVSGQPALILDSGSTGKAILKVGSSIGVASGETQYYTGAGTNNYRTGYDGSSNPTPQFYLATPSTRALVIGPDGRILIGLADTNGVPAAQLHITSAAGSPGALLNVSTGGTTIFQVSGLAGVLISSMQTQPIILAPMLAATNSPSDTQVPKYDAATGKITWSADNNSGGGGGGSAFRLFVNNQDTGINPSTVSVIVGNGLAIQHTSGTVIIYMASTGTLAAQQLTLTSPDSLIYTSNTVMNVSVGGSTFSFTASSFSINTAGTPVRYSTTAANTSDVLANKNIDAANSNVLSFRDYDRFTTPAFGSGTFVTYIASPTMGIASSTLGAFQFNNAISSQANFGVWTWIPPVDIDLTAPIRLSSFGIILGGADTNSQVYQISIATTQTRNVATETRFSGTGAWLSSATVVIPADPAGVTGDLETSTGAIVLGGWQNVIIPGQLHYVIISRDGDHNSDSSTVNSFSAFHVINYKRRLGN